MKNYLVLRKTLVISALLAVTPPVFAADTYTQVTEIFPPDPATNQFFGFAAAISDNLAVVGAPFTSEGAAYVYLKTDGGWVFQQKLEASDGPGQLGFNQFGWSVAIAGDTIAVAAPRRVADGKTGAVYVFKRAEGETNWTEQAIVTSPTIRPFAVSVALQAGTLAVGALEDRSGGGSVDSGLAFVFVRSGDEWVVQASLMSSDLPANFNRWGASVDIRGKIVALVASEDSSGGGPVYVFSRQGTTWTQDTKLASGEAVSLWGNSLAVGDESNVSIYEHAGQNWQLTQTLAGIPGTAFGDAVDLREDSLLVGARREGPGVAYLYGFDAGASQWVLTHELPSPDGQSGDNFGITVSLSATAAIVGSPRHFHPPNPQSGAAYIYEP
jgi:hypothetical protein